MGQRDIGWAELAKHTSENDCWIAIHGSVYDVSNFLDSHPGGKNLLTDQAGTDGTKAFSAMHPKSMLETLGPEAKIGTVDSQGPSPPPPKSQGSAPKSDMCACWGACWKGVQEMLCSTKKVEDVKDTQQPTMTLDSVINVNDFEIAAEKLMNRKGYNYYASAAGDEITKRENCSAYARVWLRPRVMIDVETVDLTCTLLGTPSTFPLFISSAAMAGLAHPDGEVALARAAGKYGIVQIIANLASRDLEDIAAARIPGQEQWFQVYINPDRKKSEVILNRIIASGVTTLFITVDTNVIGRRERDQRHKILDRSNLAKTQMSDKPTSGGVIGALGHFNDAKLCWKDLPWLRSICDGRVKLVLKGIQTGEDAVLAAQNGLDGILVSNHGGRQIDSCRPTLDVLAEVTTALREADLMGKMEVFLDGGIRRGTDIYKGLALGAKAVGIGRPALYALQFGQEGVEKCLQILLDEFKNCMQLMGKKHVGEISSKDVARAY